MKKLYVIRWALTKGILIVDATKRTGPNKEIVGYQMPGIWGSDLSPEDYAFTLEDAKLKAEAKLKARLNSLARSMGKLKKLENNWPVSAYEQ